MNRAGSMSLRARINNYAKRERVSPQHALQGFFIERFLARIERSEYAGNLVIKGGTLMCSILGLPQRTTMDIDATVVGIRADEATILRIVESVASVDVGDGVSFRRDSAPPATRSLPAPCQGTSPESSTTRSASAFSPIRPKR